MLAAKWRRTRERVRQNHKGQRAECSPASRSLASKNSDSDTFGYASASLAASGAPEADGTASTAGSLPGAFDRDGIDAQTPPPVVGALSNVCGLAFNTDGALWVNYDGTLALLTALESGTVTPDIQVQADVLALPEGIALPQS